LHAAVTIKPRHTVTSQKGADAMANPNQRGRTENGRYIRTPEQAQRDAQAADLRADGHTLQHIADTLGYSDRSAARRGIQRALRDIVQGPAERLLALHMDRLELLYAAATDILERDHPVVSHGKVVTMPDPETGEEKPLIDDGPKLAAIREARSTLDAFWSLTGMKQPAKVQVSGGVRYEVVGVDPADLT
jgi:hypothetical protein